LCVIEISSDEGEELVERFVEIWVRGMKRKGSVVVQKFLKSSSGSEF